MKSLDKFATFIFDMKNLLSVGALFVFIYCTITGVFDAKDIFTIVMMTFTFFLGSKVNKS